jgi:hypothetical protein
MAETDSNSGEKTGYFRFCNPAKDFVSKLKNNPESAKFGTQIEFYWLCAQLGLIVHEKDKILPKAPPAGTEMTSDWAGETRQNQFLIRAFVMYRYLCDLGYQKVHSDSAGPIENAMDQFLQMTGTHLTIRGMKEMDRYAQKGWDLIHDGGKGISRTNTMSLFLCRYVDLVDGYID